MKYYRKCFTYQPLHNFIHHLLRDESHISKSDTDFESYFHISSFQDRGSGGFMCLDTGKPPSSFFLF